MCIDQFDLINRFPYQLDLALCGQVYLNPFFVLVHWAVHSYSFAEARAQAEKRPPLG
jgi:hypothetical protein